MIKQLDDKRTMEEKLSILHSGAEFVSISFGKDGAMMYITSKGCGVIELLTAAKLIDLLASEALIEGMSGE